MNSLLNKMSNCHHEPYLQSTEVTEHMSRQAEVVEERKNGKRIQPLLIFGVTENHSDPDWPHCFAEVDPIQFGKIRQRRSWTRFFHLSLPLIIECSRQQIDIRQA